MLIKYQILSVKDLTELSLVGCHRCRTKIHKHVVLLARLRVKSAITRNWLETCYLYTLWTQTLAIRVCDLLPRSRPISLNWIVRDHLMWMPWGVHRSYGSSTLTYLVLSYWGLEGDLHGMKACPKVPLYFSVVGWVMRRYLHHMFLLIDCLIDMIHQMTCITSFLLRFSNMLDRCYCDGTTHIISSYSRNVLRRPLMHVGHSTHLSWPLPKTMACSCFHIPGDEVVISSVVSVYIKT